MKGRWAAVRLAATRMAFELVLPDIGEGVVEAEVQKWFVKPGDEVVEDQPLVEVMTDKATVTIPSPRRGRVARIHCAEGQVVRVHAPLLTLDLAGEPAAAPEPAVAAGVPADAPAAPAPLPAGKALATPAVRALARQLGVDVASVRGSGPGGRVLKEDLAPPPPPAGAAPPVNGAAHGPDAAWTSASARPASPMPPPERGIVGDAGDEVVPLRGIRRRIAERMAQSKRTAAHSTFVESVDVTELTRVKGRVAAAAREEGVKVTFMPFIVKAVVAALKRHPWLNASLDEARGEIRLRRALHIGVAAATDGGLVVPVVRDAGHRSLLDLAREIDRLAVEARAGRLRPEDVGGSTFTVSSLGPQGGLLATPVINYPEVAILGVHRIRPTPVVHEGQIVARDVMNLSLSFDHRVVDGHVAAAFTYAVIRYLEDPSLLFMELV